MSEQSSWTEDRESNTSSQDQTVPADSESHQIASDKRDEPHLDLNSSQDEYLSLIFRDGLDMPIDGLTFIATYPSGFVCTAESTLSGAIALPKPKAEEGEVKVEVKNSSGRKQPVCSIDLAKCEGAVIVRSPKTKAKVSLQPHQQVAPAKTPSAAPKPPEKVEKKQEGSTSSTPEKVDRSQAWWGANGALGKAWAWLSEKHFFGGAPAPAPADSAKAAAQGLSSAGQPVSALVGPEGPNKDNLRLGRNNVYRQVILDASKRLGLIPQALCALMDCEAGKVSEKIALMRPDGTPVKDKKGRPVFKRVTELWDANAGNASSGAAGLTQFLAATWLAHVLIPGRYIHEKSVASGWVKQVADSKGKKSWMFVLEDGSTTLQPYAKRMSDANVKKCLAMRMDPAWSINAAADYGCANLKVLEGAKFKLNGLNDMDRAKLMYLMHHEGEGAGPKFVQNKLASTDADKKKLKKKFAQQLAHLPKSDGTAEMQKLVDLADGDVEVAYRFWLAKYIDMQFSQSTKYFIASPIETSKLSALLVRIGGKEVESVD